MLFALLVLTIIGAFSGFVSADSTYVYWIELLRDSTENGAWSNTLLLEVPYRLTATYNSVHTYDRLETSDFNVTAFFETALVEIHARNTTIPPRPTALEAATWFVNNLLSSNEREHFNLTNVTLGRTPMKVPSYLRSHLPETDTLFTILGGIAAVVFIVQAAYGVYHGKTTHLVPLFDERE